MPRIRKSRACSRWGRGLLIPRFSFLSQRYAVLQVNHRRSGGYGREFAMKGVGAVGATDTVQHDLADAVKWAVEQGVADPERVVIWLRGETSWSRWLCVWRGAC